MRTLHFLDRYGQSIESDITIESFAALFDSIADVSADEDWREVAIMDSDEWATTFSPDYITFENVEDDEEEGEIRPTSRELALEVADAFLRGDFEAIRAHFGKGGT